MSFEGHYQVLCTRGHASTEDAYDSLPADVWRCHCGAKMAWWNLVDYTNGSEDEQGNPIDGHVELEVLTTKRCEHCGSKLEVTYKIPDKVGHSVEE